MACSAWKRPYMSAWELGVTASFILIGLRVSFDCNDEPGIGAEQGGPASLDHAKRRGQHVLHMPYDAMAQSSSLSMSISMSSSPSASCSWSGSGWAAFLAGTAAVASSSSSSSVS